MINHKKRNKRKQQSDLPEEQIVRFNFKCDTINPNIPFPLPNHSSFTFLIIGAPGSGKSNLLLNLLCREHEYYNQVFTRVFLFSPSTGSTDKDWFGSLPDEQRFAELSQANLQTVYNRIQSEKNKQTLIVFDDVVNKTKKNDQLLLTFMHNRRHLGGSVSIMFTTQVLNRFPLELRKAIEYVICFKLLHKKEIESFYEDFVTSMSFDTFEAVMDYVFQKEHDFLFVDVNHRKYYRNFGPTPLTIRVVEEEEDNADAASVADVNEEVGIDKQKKR